MLLEFYVLIYYRERRMRNLSERYQRRSWQIDSRTTVTVGHPLLATYLKKACREKGYTLKILEEKKDRKYGVSCAEVGADFQGFAFESYGAASDKVFKMIHDLCLHASRISGIDYSRLTTYWKKRLSTTMQKENAKFIMKVSKLILTKRFQNRFHSRVPHVDCVNSEHVHNNRV